MSFLRGSPGCPGWTSLCCCQDEQRCPDPWLHTGRVWLCKRCSWNSPQMLLILPCSSEPGSLGPSFLPCCRQDELMCWSLSQGGCSLGSRDSPGAGLFSKVQCACGTSEGRCCALHGGKLRALGKEMPHPLNTDQTPWQRLENSEKRASGKGRLPRLKPSKGCLVALGVLPPWWSTHLPAPSNSPHRQ